MSDQPVAKASNAAIFTALGLVYFIWGSIYLAIRLVIDEAPPLGSMGVRFLLAGIILGIFLMVRGGFAQFRITKREALGLVFMGISLLAIGNGLTSVAQLVGVSSGLTALLIAMVPLWIAVLRLASGDRPSLLSSFGIVLGFAGLVYLVVVGRGDAGGALPLVGVLVVVFSSFSWAFGSWIQSKIWLPHNVFAGVTYQLLAAGITLTVASLATHEDLHGSYGLKAWGALIYLVIVGSIIGFSAYVWLLSHAPLSLIATHAYVNPVVALFLGWLVLSEPITWAILVGGGIVLVSVVIVISAEKFAKNAAPDAVLVAEPR